MLCHSVSVDCLKAVECLAVIKYMEDFWPLNEICVLKQSEVGQRERETQITRMPKGRNTLCKILAGE